MASKKDDSGWKLIKSNNQSFLVRRCFSEENFKVQLTDHRRLWSAEGPAKDLLLMSQKENPLFEFSLSKVTQNIFKEFDKSLDLLRVEGNDIMSRTLVMSITLDCRSFKLVWTLSDQGADVLYKEVTGPLLIFVSEMSLRQHYLCNEIQKKDTEITDHVLENGALRRGLTKTEKFNREVFMAMFTSLDTSDPILSAWETHDEALSLFNKIVLSSKTQTDSSVENTNLNPNEVAIKEEVVVKQEPTTVPENNSLVEHAIQIPVKQEKTDETLVKTRTQSKRKKVKLNI